MFLNNSLILATSYPHLKLPLPEFSAEFLPRARKSSNSALQLWISTSALEWNVRPIGDLPWRRGGADVR